MKKTISSKRALEIINNFPTAKVLVVGDIMIDHFIWGQVSRISPEAPVPIVDVQMDNLLLGGAANVMNNIHAMDGIVYGMGIIGDDDMGGLILKELASKQINTDGIVVGKGRRSTQKTRIIAHNQQIVRFDREDRAPSDQKTTEWIINRINAIRRELDAIVISDYSKGVVTDQLLAGIRDAVRDTDIVVCADTKKNDYSLYEGFHIITPNHHEAGHAVGWEILNHDALMKAGTVLMNRYNFPALLITRGEEGMSLFERGEKITHTEFPTEAREVFDVTGAGDTVIGVFALCMASGATFREAAFLANHAAGIAVSKIGTTTVSRRELENRL